MRTLFSENILSPTPTPLPIDRSNPFELSFASASIPTGSNTSSNESTKQDRWLTQYYREQQRFANEVHIQSNQDATTRNGQVRRKGNPKVLFMGMRR
jgi:Ras-related GTP-binding protein C/D